MGIQLKSVSGVLPARDIPGSKLDNERLCALIDRASQAMSELGSERVVLPADPLFPEVRAGIRERRVLDDDLTSRDMALLAGRRALERSRIAPDRVRIVIVTTVTADRVAPSLACSVHDALGLGDDVVAFDVALGCNGFVCALDIAGRLLNDYDLQDAALVIASETMTRVLDACDRATFPLFGDGAGAAVIQRSEGRGSIHRALLRTLGAGAELIQISNAGLGADEPVLRVRSKHGDIGLIRETESRQRVVMEGRRVFRDVTRELVQLIESCLESEGLRVADVDAFAFHQANQRMIDAVASSPKLAIPKGKLLMNIAQVGNTTSASIPLLLAESALNGSILPGQRILLVGFGTGLSLGAMLVEWDNEVAA